MKRYLQSLGFTRVLALPAAPVNGAYQTLLMCLWAYGAETALPPEQGAIHPYYPAAQQAYLAAKAAVAEGARRGLTLRQDTQLPLKPLFARLRGFAQGRNTLSYVPGLGSRFHVQALWMREACPEMDELWEEAPHGDSCGSCRRCLAACPTGALTPQGFVREKCLRNWMLGGQAVPEGLRKAMGNRLVGCDACQRACPRNAALSPAPGFGVALAQLLADPKGCAAQLAPVIGVNLALPNRLLAQGLLCAGNSGQAALGPLAEALTRHPSPQVADHARWALAQLA